MHWGILMDEKEIMIQYFKKIEPQLRDMVDGDVHLIEKIKSRWAYVDGKISTSSSHNMPIRFLIHQRWALVCYPKNQQDVHQEEIKKMFAHL